jgi:hypothetical protein
MPSRVILPCCGRRPRMGLTASSGPASQVPATPQRPDGLDLAMSMAVSTRPPPRGRRWTRRPGRGATGLAPRRR